MIVRTNTSEVPDEWSTSPSASAPAPTIAATWSWPPIAITAPRAAGSASPTRPTGVPPATGSAMKSSPTPSQASASGHQRRSRSSSRPVREASDSSATSAAPSDRATHSGTPSQRTAARAPASWERCQRSLASVHSAEAGRPVRAANSCAPSAAASSAAASAPRASCQAIAGPTGRPAASSSTPVSAMPATPIPATAPAGAAASASPATDSAVRASACGSISAPVGTRVHGIRARAWPSSRPSAPRTIALQYVVPTSMPRSSDSKAQAAASTIASISSIRRRAIPSRKRRRPSGGVPTASFHSERPAMKPSAPPSIASRSWAQNASWSTPADSTAHGTSSASVTRRQPSGAARILELEQLGPALLQQHGALDDEVLLARGELLGRLVVRAVGHELHHAQQVGAAAVLERGAHDRGGVAVEVLAVGAQEHHHLGGGGAERAGAGRAEAVDQRRAAQAVALLVPVGLDPHDQPDVARHEIAVDERRQRDVGVEQHGARLAADRVDQVGLERALGVGRAGDAERVEHRDQGVAVVGGDDGEAPARRLELRHGAPFGRGGGRAGPRRVGSSHRVLWFGGGQARGPSRSAPARLGRTGRRGMSVACSEW